MSAGFFGKVPSVGDFVSRRVPVEIQRQWDNWLQQGLSVSQNQLGPDWLDFFLTSPVWHFSCSPGVLGENHWSGVMIPSVDRVGRYFPLTMLAEWPASPALARQIPSAEWFDQATAIILTALMDPFDMDAFDFALQRLTQVVPQPFKHPASITHERFSIWMTHGSQRMGETCLFFEGLPPANRYGELLGAMPPRPKESAVMTKPIPTMASQAWTHQGFTRSSNQDAVIDRADSSFWAVADGMGGHQGGEIASQSICRALHALQFESDEDLSQRLVRLHEAIQTVHHELHAYSLDTLGGQIIGSTLVLLVIDKGEGAVIWAGDSRLYRLRNGTLAQLTEDHVPEPSLRVSNANEISRAVGATPNLELETRHFKIEPGDRYLLCSDGLYREVVTDQLSRLLAMPTLPTAGEALLTEALEHGGRDNISLIVMDCPQPA